MTLVPTDCTLAMMALLHAIPGPSPDTTIAGMPAAVFGNIVSGVVGSVITLFGVFLSNRHNRRLKRDELGHDATQRDREREMALRREVFLPAVESALAMQSALASLINPEMPVAQSSERFQTSNAILAKVAAVGAPETVAACQALSSCLGVAFWELSLQRAALQNHQNRLADLDRSVAIHEGLRDSWIKVQQDLVAKGEKTAEIWQAARGHFTHHMAEIAKALTERSKIIRERESKLIEVYEVFIKQLDALGPKFPPALFAMRRELQLPLDEAAFLDRFTNLRTQQLAMIKEALAQARANLAAATVQPATVG
ncbi:hypothetical protein [Burkholderia sp. JP2-270]|uniref:hypothetical protein n=1 Tax=Burkholderia sp. JP2-270 TaxID=2217913 RepID=UPI0013A6C0AD|nr:hypothetical protein [Burkholderia sp. JP2-270]